MVSLTLFLGGKVTFAENIDPYNDNSQYAYGENVGWLNAEPLGDGGPGVAVEDTKLTGYIWAENIGWVSLSCENTGSCGTVNYGITNDGNGNLSGYAWGENIGWITLRSTAPVPFGVTTAWCSVDMNLPAGWSMISLPVNPTDKRLKMLFPGAVVVYDYVQGTGYTRVGNDDDLEIGKGYWILLNQDTSYTLTGDLIRSYTQQASSDKGGGDCLDTENTNVFAGIGGFVPVFLTFLTNKGGMNHEKTAKSHSGVSDNCRFCDNGRVFTGTGSCWQPGTECPAGSNHAHAG